MRTCSLHGIALLVTDQGRVQARGKGNENLFVDDHTCRAKRKVPRLVLIGTKERTLRDVVACAFRVDQWEKLQKEDGSSRHSACQVFLRDDQKAPAFDNLVVREWHALVPDCWQSFFATVLFEHQRSCASASACTHRTRCVWRCQNNTDAGFRMHSAVSHRSPRNRTTEESKKNKDILTQLFGKSMFRLHGRD